MAQLAHVPYGVLFRGGSDGIIRTKFIEENLLDAVIRLPSNLFYRASIPASILIFKTNRKDKSVFFIDASRECQDLKNQNRLTKENIDKIISTYRKKKESKNIPISLLEQKLLKMNTILMFRDM
jgi:type I restriction enzyme M protein